MSFRTDVLAWRDKIAKRARREADNLASALARLGAWALDRGELDRNVLDKIKRVYHSDRADKLWLPQHIEGFTRVASQEMYVALMLAMHTGQRLGDLRRLPWSGYDGERITLRQGKGGKIVSVRCTIALRTVLDGMERRSPLVLTTPTGRAWTKRSVPDPAREPDEDHAEYLREALDYMGIAPGRKLTEIAVDRVFIGSCTNSRIEDLRAAAAVLAGRTSKVPGLVSAGSSLIKRQAEEEGLDRIFRSAGLESGESGYSVCVGMNGDLVAPGERFASTTNRNFRGRQGPGARTHLMSPAMVAAAAVTGRLSDVRPLLAGRKA